VSSIGAYVFLEVKGKDPLPQALHFRLRSIFSRALELGLFQGCRWKRWLACAGEGLTHG
jgi:hypothetical protein